MKGGARFSLAWLLIATAIVALGCTAMVTMAELWCSVVITSTIGMLCAALLLAIFTRGPGRSFWIACSIFGFGYIALTFNPSYAPLSASLMTTRGLAFGWRLVDHPLPPPSRTNQVLPFLDDHPEYYSADLTADRFGDPTYFQYRFQMRAFFFAGQCLWALALGALAGFVASYLYDRQRRLETNSAP